MEQILKLWELILQSNTFNFVVLVVILTIVMQKMNISEKLVQLKDEIISKLEASRKAKEDAEEYYTEAKSKTKNLPQEISERLNLANKQADNVAEMIKESKNKKLKQLSDNVIKIIDAETKTLITNLHDRTAGDAINIASRYIKNKIKEEPELQNRYIDESIRELEKITL
jgi:F0F1-type ATP synthase membrane subunit b/b'